jgi:hypothetical protein
MHVDIYDVVAEGNKVVVLRFTNSGQNTGRLMGLEPTHHHI